jgi:Flp pilus assembly protein TadB
MQWINSPFVVPLGAFAVGIVAIVAGIWHDAQRNRVRADQRMAMVARGIPLDQIEKLLGKRDEEEKPVRDPLRSLANARRAAVILIASGIGVVAFFVLLMVILQERDVLAGAAVGVIPVAIGIGFWVDYNLQKRELSRFGMEASGADV